MIYEQEKAAAANPAGSYKGLQLFDIFEEFYLKDLAAFLQQKNTKLFCLLSLRAQQANLANSLLKEQVIPST